MLPLRVVMLPMTGPSNIHKPLITQTNAQPRTLELGRGDDFDGHDGF